MKVHIMNSAMMPVTGTYRYKKLTMHDFLQGVIDADRDGSLASSIGYEQNRKLIEEYSGVKIALSRERTDLRDGDVMLVMTLKYRVDGSFQKGSRVSIDDFEFGRVDFSKV